MSSHQSTETGFDPTDFPVGGGEMGRLIRAFDWSTNELGPISSWSPSLRTATNIVLQSPLPLVMLWGPNGIMIYNDAYSVFAGGRHPRLLGSRVLEGWAEVADFNAKVLEAGLAGRTLSFKDQELTLHRNNVPEQVWMDLNYGPVLGDDNKPAGVLAIVIETSGRVRAEQALARQRDEIEEANKRLSAESAFLHELFEQAPGFMCMLSGRDQVFTLTNAAYRSLIGHRDVFGQPAREALPELQGQGFFELLDNVFVSGKPFIGRGMEVRLQREPGAPLETRIVDLIYQPVKSPAGEIVGIFAEGQDVTERAAAEQHLRLVINELNHRVKNTLAMMQAIAIQTFRSTEPLDTAHAKFSARIKALASASDLLTGEHWVGASLQQTAERVLAPYVTSAPERRVITGPSVTLTPKSAISVSMALHELATNATKYGAWSGGEGRVTLEWTVVPTDAGSHLKLEWRESGGPAVVAPTRRGFGSRLIERGLAAELGGTVVLDFRPQGLVCMVDAPLNPYADHPQ